MRTYMVVTVNPLGTCPNKDEPVGSLYQYDYGQRVAIGGVDLPAAYEVHFSNKKLGESVTVIGDETGVDIPDEMLLTGQDIHLWLYLHQGEDDGETVWYARIAVKERAKPTHEQPTPVQQDEITQAIAALNAAVESTEEDAAAAEASAQRAEAAEAAAEAAQNLAETAQTGAEAAMRAAEAAQTGAETADEAAEAAQEAAEGARDRAEAAAQLLESPAAEAETLSPGAQATAEYEDGTFTFGIPAGAPGQDGEPGADGYSPSAAVSKTGGVATITITDKSGTTTAEIIDGQDGEPGDDGYSPSASVSKSGRTTTITITDKSGTTTAEITDGTDGYSPVRGTDYWTAADKAEIVSEVEADFSEDFADITADISQLKSDLDGKAPAITQTASGDIVTITDGADGMPLSACTVQINPVQDTSGGDPSLSHVCPITGHTGANVRRTGKNLFGLNEYTLAGATVYTEGEYPDSYTGNKHAFYRLHGSAGSDPDALGLIGRKPFGQLTISFYNYSTGNTRVYFHYTDADDWVNHSGNISSVGVKVYTSDANRVCDGVALETTQGSTANFWIGQLQIEIGSTATRYESPLTQTYHITFPSAAGMVYGGSLDTVTGVLTVTDGQIASYAGETLPGAWISDRDVYTPGGTPTTGAQVVYKLATPQTYQLDPVQITTLLGENHIWADTGAISLTYPADTKLYIQQLTKPTEDDMTANAAITSGKFFMVGNRLFLATAAIAVGATIIPGTNCTELSLADALNNINA